MNNCITFFGGHQKVSSRRLSVVIIWIINFQQKSEADVGRDGGLEVVVIVGHQERTASLSDSLSQNSTSQNHTGSIYILKVTNYICFK